MRHLLLGSVVLAALITTGAAADHAFRAPKSAGTPVTASRAGRVAPIPASDRIELTPQEQQEARGNASQGEIKSILNVPTRMRYGQFIWDDRGVPNGPLWIRVDLGSQILSVFRAGDEIGTAVILYGADRKETPQGVFPILAKDKDHISSIYDAAMPFTLRLTPDGVSIHGSDVRWGLATHGCIGVPIPFAKLLFDQVRKGDRVVIVDGPRRDA